MLVIPSEFIRKILHPRSLYNSLLWKLHVYRCRHLFARYYLNSPDKQNAIIIGSYPRCGSTYFRLLWFNIIAIQEIGSINVDFDLMEKNMPFEGYYNDLRQTWLYETLPCLLKTHLRYARRYKDFRAIHLFRHPLDAMISNYHYHLHRIGGPSIPLSWIERQVFNSDEIRYSGSFSEFLRAKFDGYCSFIQTWVDSNALPLSYKSLMSNSSESCLVELFKELDVDVDETVLNKAINRSDRRNMANAARSAKMATLNGMSFIRNGTCGQWKSYCKSNDVEFVVNKLSEHNLLHPQSFPERYRTLIGNGGWVTESNIDECVL